VVLDEPTNGLNPAEMKRVRDLFRMLRAEYGMAFLISSHLLSEIESIADTIGCGEIATVQLLPEMFESFHEKCPRVNFDLYTATADHVKDQMDRGLVDIGLLLEPIDIEKYDFIRLAMKGRWGVLMRPDSPLAGKDFVTAKANNLKPYDYFEYLLTEIPKHLDDTDRTFLDDLLPWSPNLPANCRKPSKEEVK
jgi:DNA-binding transcriptional LysR family regulator